jgi:gas vesicle protein
MKSVFNIITLTQKSLFEELWEYFVDTYFSPDMPYLENIDMGTGSLISLRTIIFGLTIGIVIAAACSIFNKRYVGDFVRKVIYEECFSKESAKTLYELGYQKDPAIRGMVKTGGSLSRVIHCVEEDEYMEKIQIQREEYEKAH